MITLAFGFISAIISAETAWGPSDSHFCTSHQTLEVMPVPVEFIPITGISFACAFS